MDSSDQLFSAEQQRPRSDEAEAVDGISDDGQSSGGESWDTIEVRHDGVQPRSTDPREAGSTAAEGGEPPPTQIGRYGLRRLLGKGSYGAVWLAIDDELQRPVAIKVPRRTDWSSDDSVAQFLQEARTVARLKHSGIVTVYDVGRTDGGGCFVVMEFIEGQALVERLRAGRLACQAAAQMMEQIAEAVHYAHTRGFVHRDLKPGNILLDVAGRPHVADFGLAIHEEQQRQSRGGLAGSPPYMAPEQVRGESHRLDGRTDIWALGVMLYELIAGRRPFTQPIGPDLFDEILHRDPKPPRQIDDAVPIDLERICLKCLSKRMSDRYSTAADLAADLRLCREQMTPATASASGHQRAIASRAPATNEAAAAERVVPKGLRSFDAHDADFFLKLLPGPVDRQGLPESVRFWKTRTETSDAEHAFSVGLIYGPSGCGKSSLVKAGLLPRLRGDVSIVYIEAAREATEPRLLRALRRQLPDEDRGGDLDETVAALRRGPHERKTLIVLDQFEQWLHTRREGADAELVRALRQCDGPHVQCLILVRDDFWLAVSRFFRELEIPLLEGHNSALVDLFDPLHARRVLSEFGRAFGRLPEDLSTLTAEQQHFLDEAVAGLSEDGKVVSVRLALFAEMVKGKPWTPATLRALGGATGVGVAFLEETFSSPTSPPAHRLHQQAARATLQALLPEQGIEIKGFQRTRDELLAASGYQHRPQDFDELLRILDNELRLVTPAGADGSSLSFQLTHDYLVPSVREWLTRKQRETRRGRAELRLAERAADWNVQNSRRRLPSFWEWAQVALWTRRRDWTDSQRRCMHAAGRHHLTRLFLLWLAIGLASWGTWELNGQARGRSLREQLFLAKTSDVAGLLPQIARYQRWVGPLLESSLNDTNLGRKQRLHAQLALLRSDPAQASELTEQLLDAGPDELPVIRQALAPFRQEVTGVLWEALESPRGATSNRLRAACALADFDPENERWGALLGQIADWLVHENPVQAGQWADDIRGVWPKLVVPVVGVFRDPAQPEPQRTLAANLLAYMSADDTALIASLVKDARAEQLPLLLAALRSRPGPAVSSLVSQLDETMAPRWPDEAEQATSPVVSDKAVERIERSDGILADKFALTQTLPADELGLVDAALQSSGYRLLCLRPYPTAQQLQVAALWTRDGREVRWTLDGSAEELAAHGKELSDGFAPFDVACYARPTGDLPGELRYSALWAKNGPEAAEAKFVLGVDEKQYLGRVVQEFVSQGFTPRTQTFVESNGRMLTSAIWYKPPDGSRNQVGWPRVDESMLDQINTVLATDLRVGRRPSPKSVAERSKESLVGIEASLKSKPDDLASRANRATALFWLQRYEEAIADATEVLKEFPRWESGYYTRAISYARLGRAEEARHDVDRFGEISSDLRQQALVATVVAGVLDDPSDWRERLEVAIAAQSNDAQFIYTAALAYAALAKGAEASRAESFVKRAIELLRQAIDGGYEAYANAATDPALEAAWSDPAFQKLIWGDDYDVQFSVAGRESTGYEHEQVRARGTAQHLARCRELAAADYRPRSLCVTYLSADRPLMATSVWHRPVVADQARDALARQQAQVAVALYELEEHQRVWPLLRQTNDSRRPTFLVHGLASLASHPRALVERLTAEPDASARRALLWCLAERSPDGLSLAERERVVERVLDLYRDDPDAGVHSGADLLLRRWGQRAACQEVDRRLAGRAPPDGRRWYVNGQEQTYTVVEGPLDFSMGSPSYEPGRKTGELLHRRRIGRSFAMATKEVTVAQFHRFLQQHPIAGVLEEWEHNPDTNGPMIPLTWFQAAQYCRWLSEQEGLAEEDMCYPALGQIQAGMNVPADYLHRSGYRLPTEAEWECACRAGAETARAYGSADELLGKYAWYVANAKRRAWPVGSLLPNDGGCFDMLGNALEWCHDRNIPYQTVRHGGATSDRENTLTITGDDARILRGGSFEYPAEVERSAQRLVLPPGESWLYVSRGFRPARTLPSEMKKSGMK